MYVYISNKRTHHTYIHTHIILEYMHTYTYIHTYIDR